MREDREKGKEKEKEKEHEVSGGKRSRFLLAEEDQVKEMPEERRKFEVMLAFPPYFLH